ncbi:MAG: GGDEF domain-containing protein [Acidobacteria bacterium]|nr:GGDEF domain-containing protein [Acidobacteriota bacterium]
MSCLLPALPFRRRHVYAWAGGLLSAGAPIGLLMLRRARQWRRAGLAPRRGAFRPAASDPRDYVYVGLSTAIAFTAFGYVLGRQADRLAALSETDPLTGLCNARGLFDRLEAELARARRYREPLALVLVDLDGLKRINDEFGHRAGDEAIRCLADVIRSELRSTDIGARWGGDEFAVLAPSTARDAALALAERIRASIPRRSERLRLSGSLGVAAIEADVHDEAVDSATLMRAADAALYEAKRSGRNRVVVSSLREPPAAAPAPATVRAQLPPEGWSHGRISTDPVSDRSE